MELFGCIVCKKNTFIFLLDNDYTLLEIIQNALIARSFNLCIQKVEPKLREYHLNNHITKCHLDHEKEGDEEDLDIELFAVIDPSKSRCQYLVDK